MSSADIKNTDSRELDKKRFVYETKGSVVIFHPGHVLVSYNSALALEQAGMLFCFETGLYFRRPGFLELLLSNVPGAFPKFIYKQLMRRHHIGLPVEKIKTHNLIETLYLLSVRIGVLNSWSDSVMKFRNKLLARKAASTAVKMKSQILTGYDSCSLEAFEVAKKQGVICVLDQVVGSWSAGKEILDVERKLNPDFASTIPEFLDDSLVQQTLDEAVIADKILVASEYVRDTIIADGIPAKKIVLCPYGVDIDRFSPAISEKNNKIFKVLFVGQLTQRKGIKYLLQAFSALHLPNIELILMGAIGGEGEALEPYRGVFTHVKNVPYEDLPFYYQSADIFVYPSLHEGSALAIYEALASGLPVVTTFNSGSIVRDGVEGYIVPVQNVEAIKEKIEDLYHDAALRKRMAAAARLRAEAFSWEKYKERVAQIYKEISCEEPE